MRVAHRVAVTCLAAAAAAPTAAFPPLVQAGAIGPGWRPVNLPQQTLPFTQYSVETVDGREALRVQAQASYGNLVHEVKPAAAAPRLLKWSWRVQQPNPASDPRTKAGDDLPLKVCLSFDLAADRVPFVERQLLRLARSRTGEPLPAATLCWVWAAAPVKGELLPNPYTRRVRYIVLRSMEDSSSTWFEESRDVAADFQRAFGDESPVLPPVTALIVSGDADNTGGASLAHVSALRGEP